MSEQAMQIKTLLMIVAHMDERRVSAPDLLAEADISLATFKRLLQFARGEMGMVIKWVRKKSRGPFGWYEITDWGLLDARRVRAWAVKIQKGARHAPHL